ncbi:MAG: glycosyltransferase [Paludibacter sp.]|nr:glycosyltransferase [Paludibacter sp.]
MISIIICSKKSDISTSLKENIKDTIGVDYEIVVIDNSMNNYSIFSAYNKGWSKSKFPYLCFVHEDVLFKTIDWGKNLITHLTDKETGIIGIAGGKIMTRIPAHWWSVGYGYKNLIQHYKNKKTPRSEHFHNSSDARQPVILLDGVFLSMRSELFNTIQFDEELTGFHGYDHDICVQSIMACYSNYVVFDILLEHFSDGDMNSQYYINLIKIYKKWEEHLPLFYTDIPGEVRINIGKTETKLLGKLIRRMSQTGFKTNEIIRTAKSYVKLLNTQAAKKQLNFIRLKILFEKLFHSK